MSAKLPWYKDTNMNNLIYIYTRTTACLGLLIYVGHYSTHFKIVYLRQELSWSPPARLAFLLSTDP